MIMTFGNFPHTLGIWGCVENCENLKKMSFKGLEKRVRNIFYNLLLWNLACLPLYIGRIPVSCQCCFRCIKAFMHAFSGRFSRTCLEGISFIFFVCFIFNWSIGSAPKKKHKYLTLYQNWHKTPPYFELAKSAS